MTTTFCLFETGVYGTAYVEVQHLGNNGSYNVSLNDVINRKLKILTRYGIGLVRLIMFKCVVEYQVHKQT